MPTPGQAPICSIHCRAQAGLPAVQDAEAADRACTIGVGKRRVAGFTNYDPREPLPPGAPHVVSWSYWFCLAGVVAALAAETVLLADPINEALQGGTGFPLEGATAGLMIASALAFMGHERAAAIDEMHAGPLEPRQHQAASRRAVMSTVGILVAGATAVIARIYAAAIGGALDQAGIAFFLLLQTVLIVAAFTLPGLLLSSTRANRRARATAAKDAAIVDLEEAQRLDSSFASERQRQPERLAALAVGALGQHMQQLADTLDDTVLADRWRTAYAAAHRDGALRALLQDGSPPVAERNGAARIDTDDERPTPDDDEVVPSDPAADGSISLEIPLAPPPTLAIGLAMPPELEGVTVETVPPTTSTTTTSIAQTSTSVASTSPPTTAPEPPRCTLKATVENESLGFEKDSHEISPAGEALLRDFVAGVLRVNPGLRPTLVEIFGHASSDGLSAHNQALSERRSVAVERVLGSIADLAGVEMVALGFGETRPIADNGTEEGRRANRRVEILLHFEGCSETEG